MKEIVNTKLTKIALIGLGYVGLPLAMEFCKKIETIGFDTKKRRIRELKEGIDSTLEAESEELGVGLDTLIMQKMGILPKMIAFGVAGSFQTLTVRTFEPHLSVDISYVVLDELQKFSKHFQKLGKT